MKVFGNTTYLQHLTLEIAGALFETEQFQALHKAASAGELPAAKRDRHAEMRIKARLGPGIDALGPVCCFLGPEMWKVMIANVRLKMVAPSTKA